MLLQPPNELRDRGLLPMLPKLRLVHPDLVRNHPGRQILLNRQQLQIPGRSANISKTFVNDSRVSAFSRSAFPIPSQSACASSPVKIASSRDTKRCASSTCGSGAAGVVAPSRAFISLRT
jgi:hypothetical protein